MNMDGTDVRQIINESIAWPNALTIDYITEKVGSLSYTLYVHVCWKEEPENWEAKEQIVNTKLI